jgi:hypothetical protein
LTRRLNGRSIDAKGDVDLNTPFDFAGASGIIRAIHSETQARTIHVSSQAILEALERVYHAYPARDRSRAGRQNCDRMRPR